MDNKASPRAFFKPFSIILLVSLMLSSVGIAAPTPARAQEGGGERIGHNRHTGKVSFVGAPSGRPIVVPSAQALNLTPRDRALAMLQPYAADFGLANAGRDLTIKASRSEHGRNVTRFQQNHHGIPVMGGELIVNADDRGGLLSINGEVSPDLEIDVTPSITNAMAQQAAVQAMVKVHGGAASDYEASEPELWIYDSRLLEPDGTEPGLVWRMNVGAIDAGAPINELVLIDAQRGNVRLNFNQIDTAWTSEASAGAAQLLQPAAEPEAVESVQVERGPQAPLGTGSGPRYVSTTGVDTGDCTNSAAPCLTINYAIGQANAGETIFVAAGTYTGTGGPTVAVIIIAKNLTISGGWSDSFASQAGNTTIYGQDYRPGISISAPGAVTIDRLTIQHATTAIAVTSGDVIVNRTAVLDSKGNAGGGAAIRLSNGALTLNNSTVARTSWGTGIVVAAGTFTISNSTVVYNQGDSSSGVGGIAVADAALVTIRNSIIARNTGFRPNCNGQLDVTDHSIFGSWCQQAGNTGNLQIDPAITAYSIGAPAYYALRGDSIAISAGNAANCLPIDQRGVSRPQGGTCDIGAYEYAAPGPATAVAGVSGGNQRAGINGSYQQPLIAFVVDDQGSIVDGATVTFAAPPSGPSGTFDEGGNTAEALTGTDGTATSPVLRANSTGGAFQVIATTVGASGEAVFDLLNVTPTLVEVYGGSPQATVLYKSFGGPLKAQVKDQSGSVVPGVEVQFRAPPSGASASFVNTGAGIELAITDSAGIATSGGLIANGVAGPYQIQGGLDGGAPAAFFSLSNIVPDIRTYSMQTETAPLPGTWRCDLNALNCTNGVDPHADAAEANAYRLYEFYRLKLNRNSLNGSGNAIVSSVHYGNRFSNAFWDDDAQQIVFGDSTASGYTAGWPLADDVVGHELTHAMTDDESALFYYYQSGAINESLSDVFGELFDQTNGAGTDSQAVKWLIGEDITGVGAFRSMSNPPSDGGMPSSIDPSHPTSGDPDRINSANYYVGPYDNGGVHLNSGVNNKAAFLMTDGGTFNSKTVTALGANKVLAIYYEAQIDLLTSGSDYGDLYYLLPQACLNVVGGADGITTTDCLEVQDAVDAVAMTAQPSGDGTFNTDAPLCSAGFAPSDLLYDKLETSANYFLLDAPRWQLDSPYDPRAHSGAHFLYADDLPEGIADVSATQLYGTALPANAWLHFAHAYDFEYYPGVNEWYDGGVLEYSADAGAWTDAGNLLNFNGYDHTIYTYSPGNESLNNPLHGRSAFTGTSHGYISSRANLASLANKNVKFRWRMGLDYVGANWGWWLDDVRIYTCVAAVTVEISGNAGVPGVTLAYLNAGPKAAATDSSGNYSFTVPSGWSGTVTPSRVGYTFSPPTRSYNNVSGASSGQIFVAIPNYYQLTYLPGEYGSISGAVSQSVSHGGSGTQVTAVPDAGYSFSGWSDGVLTATRTDSNVTANVSAIANFVPNSLTISGNAGTPHAILNYVAGTPKTAVADGSGNYSFTVPSGWSGAVTAGAPGFSFTPASITYTGITANQTGKNYTIKPDIIVYRGGAWLPYDFTTGAYIPAGSKWTGNPGGACIPAPMDYDGDGTLEMTQLCSGAWNFYSDSGTLIKSIWVGNTAGQRPVPADYNGDGLDDIVLFKAGAWNKYDFTTATFVSGVWTGNPGGNGMAVPMDTNGDGSAEPSILSGGAWHFYNANGSYNKGIWVGNIAGQLPVPGDYNGDGADDVWVYRAGAWLPYNFTTGAYLPAQAVWTGNPAPPAGGGATKPAPMDYDGDGKLEFTVFAGGPWHFFNDNGSYNKGIWVGKNVVDVPISRRLLP